jgi:hypothetical protein
MAFDGHIAQAAINGLEGRAGTRWRAVSAGDALGAGTVSAGESGWLSRIDEQAIGL